MKPVGLILAASIVAVCVGAGIAVASLDVHASYSQVSRGSGTSGSGLRPPVITENFKLILKCDPNTTVGQEGCGEHKVLAADKELNEDVKVVFDLSGNNTARHNLVTAQVSWLTYRNADCKSQSDVYQGGTEQPVAYVYCLARDDGSRREDLKNLFQNLTQGLVKVPKFP